MIFLGLILFSFSSFGVPEAEFVRIYEALDQKQIYTQKSFTSEDGVHIRYTRFGRVKGQQGAVVIAPGRTESSLKYLELAIDLIDQGFSPVYAIDHRGQGFSDRQLADAQKGYVRVFNDYVVDFSKFINLVRADVLVDTDRLFLITHSMGGVIGLRYSLLNPDVFQKMVLFSPMMKLPFESQILAGVNLLCADQKRCENYVPFGGPFDIEKSKFEKNEVTQSSVRFDWRNHLWLRFPEIQLGAPTNHWVREAVLFNRETRALEDLQNFKVPIQMVVAQNDDIVDNQGSVEVCDRLKSCELVMASNAKHEILMEVDQIRDLSLQKIIQFFKRSPQRKIYDSRSDD